VSRADLEFLAAALPPGARLAAPGARADVVVVGTCTITADADAASRQAIRRAAREHPGAAIVAAGCYAAPCPDALRALPGVAAVVGARAHRGLPAVLAAVAAGEAAPAVRDEGPAWDDGAGPARPEPEEAGSARRRGEGEARAIPEEAGSARRRSEGEARAIPEEAGSARRRSEGEARAIPEEAGSARRRGEGEARTILDARHARPVLKIQDGCDERCTYCPVPAARGPACSMPFEAAAARAAALRARHAEVVLTGVHLGAYGRDLRPARSLEELLRAIAAGPGGRVRLSSIEPLEVPRALLRDPDARALLCLHLHLPLQSGARRVLRAMGRPHAPEELAAAVEALAALAPGVCLGADVIAGFPGETDGDHQETLALLSALPLSYLHVFPFSSRPGTPAAALPGAVPAEVRRARAAELRALSARRWSAFLGAQVGRTLEVVVERVQDGEARGTSSEFAPVRWPVGGARRGELRQVRITGSDEDGCLGAIA
jgi:threonylcarbamoyladenosine tRNA methylthiotransferase MtaB